MVLVVIVVVLFGRGGGGGWGVEGGGLVSNFEKLDNINKLISNYEPSLLGRYFILTYSTIRFVFPLIR